MKITAALMLTVGAGILAPADIQQAEAKENNPYVVEVKDGEGIFQVAHLGNSSFKEGYKLHKYDKLNIMILGGSQSLKLGEQENNNLEKGGSSDNVITVGVDGMAALPYAGNIQLAGLTLPEAEKLIYDKLSEYIKIPKLNVYLKSYGERKIYVVGNVEKQGEYMMEIDSMSVYAAISKAGGIDNRGRSKHIQVLRQIGDTLFYREVNLDGFIKKHDLSQNIELEDGDIIYVPDSGKVVFSEDVAPYINVWATYRSLTRD